MTRNQKRMIWWAGRTPMSPKCQLCGRSYPIGLIPLSYKKVPAICSVFTKTGEVVACGKCVACMPKTQLRILVERGLEDFKSATTQ